MIKNKNIAQFTESEEIIRTRLNSWILSNIKNVETRQNLFYRNYGYFFRGLETHSEYPSGEIGNDKIWDKQNEKFPGRNEKWADVFPDFGIPMPACFQMDEWEFRRNKGWILTLKISYNRNIYTIKKSFGAKKELFEKDFSQEE